MNVAVACAASTPIPLITRIGDDEHGRWIADHVRSSGADLAPTSVVAASTTSTATAPSTSTTRATYEFDLVWDLEHHTLPGAAAPHRLAGASLLPAARRGRPAPPGRPGRLFVS
jgi:fructokinase